MPKKERLIQEFSAIVGPEFVVNSEDEVRLAETATFATSQHIPFIVRPGSHEEVVACMKKATAMQAPIYPISGGRNWGLGSRVPAKDGCILLELHRLNRIVDFNEKLGYLTLEPGVTFQQAYEFLESQGSELYLSVIGGPPTASVIANTIERGDGVGPYGDRFAHTCAYRVVLPNGEVLETGFSRFESTISTTHLHRWGVGPFVDGLFSQSNLGIVTQMTFWLKPKPKNFSAFVFTISHEAQLPGAIDALQHLQKRDVIKPNSLALWNSYKFLASSTQYPWELTQGKTPLFPDIFSRLNKRLEETAFIGFGGLYAANKTIDRGNRQMVKELLRKQVKKLVFFGEREVQLANLAPNLIKRLTGVEPARMQRLLSLFKGVPANESLRSAYWRKQSDRPDDTDLHPDRDHCGIIWTCHAFPFDGTEVTQIIRGVEQIILEHHFEPNIAVIFPSERYCYMFPAVIYDRDVPGEDERASVVHDAIMTYMTGRGHAPYRLGIQSMDMMNAPQGTYSVFIRGIKNMVDPEGILAPGRYSL